MMKFSLTIVGFLLTTFAFAADEAKREMWEEPSHQLVFERGNLRILDVRIVPGVTSEFHSHHFATVYFVVQDALLRNQDEGGDWSPRADRQLRAVGGLMNRSDYVAKNTYHRVENYDEHTFHLLSVVNSAAKGTAAENESSGDLLDNQWFTEHRILLAPGATSMLLSYGNDVVLTQSREGLAHIVEEGVVHSVRSMPGAWSVHDAGSEFQIANKSTEAQVFTLLEVKY